MTPSMAAIAVTIDRRHLSRWTGSLYMGEAVQDGASTMR